MKKIGIITMHKVLNYGSALQAYALQHSIEELGYDVELIDYNFPKKQKRSLVIFLRSSILNILAGFPFQKKRSQFNRFYQKYYHCSCKTFKTSEELQKAHFDYDLYITGSDQVWNPIHVKEDTSFLLSFISDTSKCKMSYASSFASNCIKKEYKKLYARYLNCYSYISVRENSGIKIIKDLIGKNADALCDPSLLLNIEDWKNIVPEHIETKIPSEYILVYALTYAYNPYPYMDYIINKIQKKIGIHLVILDGTLHDYKREHCTIIKSAGPSDFLYLIKNAHFIITTSFHGTAFALNFGIPFYSIVKDLTLSNDNRMIDLLHKVGAISRAKQYNKLLICDDLFNKCEYEKELASYRKYSKENLARVLNSFLNKK